MSIFNKLKRQCSWTSSANATENRCRQSVIVDDKNFGFDGGGRSPSPSSPVSVCEQLSLFCDPCVTEPTMEEGERKLISLLPRIPSKEEERRQTRQYCDPDDPEKGFKYNEDIMSFSAMSRTSVESSPSFFCGDSPETSPCLLSSSPPAATTATSNSSPLTSGHPIHRQCACMTKVRIPSPPQKSLDGLKKSLRFLVFRECERRGRKCLFDSKYVVKNQTNVSTTQCNAKEISPNSVSSPVLNSASSFTYVSPSNPQEIKDLGDYIFGAVPLSCNSTCSDCSSNKSSMRFHKFTRKNDSFMDSLEIKRDQSQGRKECPFGRLKNSIFPPVKNIQPHLLHSKAFFNATSNTFDTGMEREERKRQGLVSNADPIDPKTKTSSSTMTSENSVSGQVHFIWSQVVNTVNSSNSNSNNLVSLSSRSSGVSTDEDSSQDMFSRSSSSSKCRWFSSAPNQGSSSSDEVQQSKFDRNSSRNLRFQQPSVPDNSKFFTSNSRTSSNSSSCSSSSFSSSSSFMSTSGGGGGCSSASITSGSSGYVSNNGSSCSFNSDDIQRSQAGPITKSSLCPVATVMSKKEKNSMSLPALLMSLYNPFTTAVKVSGTIPTAGVGTESCVGHTLTFNPPGKPPPKPKPQEDQYTQGYQQSGLMKQSMSLPTSFLSGSTSSLSSIDSMTSERVVTSKTLLGLAICLVEDEEDNSKKDFETSGISTDSSSDETDTDSQNGESSGVKVKDQGSLGSSQAQSSYYNWSVHHDGTLSRCLTLLQATALHAYTRKPTDFVRIMFEFTQKLVTDLSDHCKLIGGEFGQGLSVTGQEQGCCMCIDSLFHRLPPFVLFLNSLSTRQPGHYCLSPDILDELSSRLRMIEWGRITHVILRKLRKLHRRRSEGDVVQQVFNFITRARSQRDRQGANCCCKTMSLSSSLSSNFSSSLVIPTKLGKLSQMSSPSSLADLSSSTDTEVEEVGLDVVQALSTREASNFNNNNSSSSSMSSGLTRTVSNKGLLSSLASLSILSKTDEQETDNFTSVSGSGCDEVQCSPRRGQSVLFHLGETLEEEPRFDNLALAEPNYEKLQLSDVKGDNKRQYSFNYSQEVDMEPVVVRKDEVIGAGTPSTLKWSEDELRKAVHVPLSFNDIDPQKCVSQVDLNSTKALDRQNNGVQVYVTKSDQFNCLYEYQYQVDDVIASQDGNASDPQATVTIHQTESDALGLLYIDIK